LPHSVKKLCEEEPESVQGDTAWGFDGRWDDWERVDRTSNVGDEEIRAMEMRSVAEK